MACWGEVNGRRYTLRSLAPPAHPAGSAGPHRSPTPRSQEEAAALAPYLSAGPAPPRAGPRTEADGTARAGESREDPRRRSAHPPPGTRSGPLRLHSRLPAPSSPRPLVHLQAPATWASPLLTNHGRPPLTFNRHDVLALDRTNWMAGAASEGAGGGSAGAAGEWSWAGLAPQSPGCAAWGSRGRGGLGWGGAPRARGRNGTFPGRHCRRHVTPPRPHPASPTAPRAGIRNRCGVQRAPAPAPKASPRRTEHVRTASTRSAGSFSGPRTPAET